MSVQYRFPYENLAPIEMPNRQQSGIDALASCTAAIRERPDIVLADACPSQPEIAAVGFRHTPGHCEVNE